MTIWILMLVLFASLAGAGYRQGAIRVAFSLLGLIVAAMLAMPLGRLLFPLMGRIGLKNPALAGFAAPLIVFVLILILFKLAGLAAHRKVDVYYKYKGGDLRSTMWMRLNRRLGLCLGLLNATVYLLLICLVAYTLSYWTYQMGGPDNPSTAVKLVNRLGKDLESTGFVKTVRAIDPATERYYDAADVIGVIYHNPLIDARLSRYPGILSLGERPEFQDLANDKEYIEMWQRQASLAEFIKHPKTKAIIENPQLLKDIWIGMKDDLKDLRHYLETGESPKYDPEKILGRWTVDINAIVASLKKIKPNISTAELNRTKQILSVALAKAVLIAAPNHELILKGVPQIKPGTAPNFNAPPESVRGKWEKVEEDKYQLSITSGPETQQLEAAISGEKLVVQGGGMGTGLVFVRED